MVLPHAGRSPQTVLTQEEKILSISKSKIFHIFEDLPFAGNLGTQSLRSLAFLYYSSFKVPIVQCGRGIDDKEDS